MHAPDDGGAGSQARRHVGRGARRDRGPGRPAAATGGGTGGTGGPGGTAGTRRRAQLRRRAPAIDAPRRRPAARCSTSRPTRRARRSTPARRHSPASRSSSVFTLLRLGCAGHHGALFSGTSGADDQGRGPASTCRARRSISTGKTITVHVAADPGCSTDLNLAVVLNTSARPDLRSRPAFPIRPVSNTLEDRNGNGAGGPRLDTGTGAQPASILVDELCGHDLHRRDRRPLTAAEILDARDRI